MHMKAPEARSLVSFNKKDENELKLAGTDKASPPSHMLKRVGDLTQQNKCLPCRHVVVSLIPVPPPTKKNKNPKNYA